MTTAVRFAALRSLGPRTRLRSVKPALTSPSDTPLHAAASYSHLDLLRTLLTTYSADANITDTDGDSALFVCESVDAAKVLIEHGCDPKLKNSEGLTAADSIEEDGSFPLVVAYLRSLEEGSGDANGVPKPPPGVQVKVKEVEEALGPVVDEGLRAKIEELAQREDWNSVETQNELRDLIMGVVREGVAGEGGEHERNVKPRAE